MPVRKINSNYFSLTGKFSSCRLDTTIDFESNLEQDFLYHLELDKLVSQIEEQPIKIKYKSKSGRMTNYVPDFKVVFDEKSSSTPKSHKGIVLYEVKYRQDLEKNWAKLKEKFKAAIHYCSQRGWKFRIITDEELKTEYLVNCKFLDQMKRNYYEFEDETAKSFKDTLKVMKVATVNQLLNATFKSAAKQAESVGLIWKLIESNEIGADLSKSLNKHSLIWSQS